MYRDFLVAMFAMTTGFTASGIIANLYRLLGREPESTGDKVLYAAVMVIAGPNVLFENAARSLSKKSCSRWAFGLAALVAAYWSFAMGLLILGVGISI